MAEDTRRLRAKPEGSPVFRYALAPLSVAVALLLQISVIGSVPVWRNSPPLIHPTGLFQICIVAAAWFGGAGPGLLAALLATLVLPLLIEMNYPLIASFFDLPRFLAFGITGLAVGWGTTLWRRAGAAVRRSELELRHARNELEAKVLEQTAELRRREALLAGAQKVSRTGSFAWRVSTGEVLWSEETFRILGYDRATKPSVEFALRRVHPEDAALARRTVERASQDGEDFEHEHRLSMPDGSVRYVQVVARAVRDDSGSIEFVGAMMDVTERRHAEEALRKAQGELAHVTRVMTLGQLAASIAHEINQPLGAVVNNAGACLRWLAAQNVEEARQSAARVIADGHRASEIVGRIRALAKRAPMRKDWLDVNETVQEVLALTRSEVHGKRVSLETRLAGTLPPVWGDRIQIQQVVLNLLMNAIEAMSGVAEGPRELGVSTDTEDAGDVMIAVRDTGPGLDPKSLDRLFDAFYTTKPGGLGMGLAISRSIVEDHGGRLWATANAPHGAAFQFTLPTRREAAA